MTELTIEVAHANLDELVDSLGNGDVVILTRNQKQVAKLVGQRPTDPLPRKPGSAIGKLVVLVDDEEHLQDFEDYMP